MTEQDPSPIPSVLMPHTIDSDIDIDMSYYGASLMIRNAVNISLVLLRIGERTPVHHVRSSRSDSTIKLSSNPAEDPLTLTRAHRLATAARDEGSPAIAPSPLQVGMPSAETPVRREPR